ncbi:Na(+)/H(+) antiporter subunit B [Amycolatopsis sp. NPDC003865]
MTTVVPLVALAFVAVAGFAVVATPDPRRQAITLSLFSLCLTLLFVVLQAPDVALSELAVGSAVVPLLVLLTIRKVGGR